MIFFKEMVKCAREKGIFCADGEDKLRDLFWKSVPENEVFVFAPHSGTRSVRGDIDEPLDAPFPVFSMEMADKVISLPDSMDPADGVTKCIMYVEDGEDVIFFIYGARQYTTFVAGTRRSVESQASITVSGMARMFLDRLSTDKDGVEEVNAVVMLPRGGSGHKRKPHTITRIFHVTPKRSTKEYAGTREINWSHQWSVRGSWVTLGEGRVGKDRNGEYCVAGRTWRVAHTKGPAHLPLVKKTRIVEASA